MLSGSSGDVIDLVLRLGPQVHTLTSGTYHLEAVFVSVSVKSKGIER